MDINSLACAGHAFNLFFKGIEAPIVRGLAGREVFQGHEEPACHALQGHEHEGAVDHPVVIGVRVVLGFFEWIAAQVEEQRRAEMDEGLAPDLELLGAVFPIDGFPVADADGDHFGGVIQIDELVARGLLHLAGEVVGESDTFLSSSVDVRRLVDHHATGVVADVPGAGVVTSDHEDVGFFILTVDG